MRRLLFSAALLLLAAACAPSKVPPAPSAEHYLQEGESYFEKGLYQDAIASWEKVRETFYSPELNVLAEMKIAEAHFLAGDYVEAAAAYEDFLKQHPDHERTPQILYQLGMSYYNQVLSPDRDQTATHSALATFESLLKRFPEDPSKEEVEVLAARCRNLLAEHELYVGRFYLRAGKYQAAINRLQGIFTLYPSYDSRDKAYFYLGQAYFENGDKQLAIDAFNTLSREFPSSEYISKAREIVEKDH